MPRCGSRTPVLAWCVPPPTSGAAGRRVAQQADAVEGGDAVGLGEQRAQPGAASAVRRAQADVLDEAAALDDGDERVGIEPGQVRALRDGGDRRDAGGGQHAAARPAARAAVPGEVGVVEQEQVGLVPRSRRTTARAAPSASCADGSRNSRYAPAGSSPSRTGTPAAPRGGPAPTASWRARRPAAPARSVAVRGPAAYSRMVLRAGGLGALVDEDELEAPAGLVEHAVEAVLQVLGAAHRHDHAENRAESGIRHITRTTRRARRSRSDPPEVLSSRDCCPPPWRRRRRAP